MTKIIMMAMSLRKDSFNKKLINECNRFFTGGKPSDQFELLSFNNFSIPLYDGDIEAQQGIPEGVKKLGQKIIEATGIVLSTPEYNGGIPGPFKNAIDWVSRISPMPWSGKKILLLGASPSDFGAVRSLGHSRVPLESIGAFVYPEMLGLAHADLAFDTSGKLKDAATEERLKKLLFKFRDYVDQR